MSQYQVIAESLHPLLGFACCPNCQGGLRVDGKPTREGLEQLRDLVDRAQRAMREYEKELQALERQELLESIEAESRAFCALPMKTRIAELSIWTEQSDTLRPMRFFRHQ